MLCKCTGGPLDGQIREVSEEQAGRGYILYCHWGRPTDAFSLADPLILHRYVLAGDELLWVEPEKIIE